VYHGSSKKSKRADHYLVLTCEKLLKDVQDNYHERSENVQSPAGHEVVKIPRALFDRLVDTLAFTA